MLSKFKPDLYGFGLFLDFLFFFYGFLFAFYAPYDYCKKKKNNVLQDIFSHSYHTVINVL